MSWFEIMIIAGAVVLTLAFRAFDHPLARKLAGVSLLGTSFFVGYFLTGEWVIGILFGVSWLFLPWIELLTRVRRTTLPTATDFIPRFTPSGGSFPQLGDWTGDFERLGFERVEDTGWSTESQRHFYRLLYHSGRHVQATICQLQQGPVSVGYLMLLTRHESGVQRITWTYPFSESLVLHPQTEVCIAPDTVGPEDLVMRHDAWIGRVGERVVEDPVVAVDPEALPRLLREDISRQIDHNLRLGLLSKSETGEVHYTLRGLFFLWFQFLRDLVRL